MSVNTFRRKSEEQFPAPEQWHKHCSGSRTERELVVIDFLSGENEETRPVSQMDGTDNNHECAFILAVLCVWINNPYLLGHSQKWDLWGKWMELESVKGISAKPLGRLKAWSLGEFHGLSEAVMTPSKGFGGGSELSRAKVSWPWLLISSLPPLPPLDFTHSVFLFTLGPSSYPCLSQTWSCSSL